MAGGGEKTEKASPRRLEKARKDGDFPAAREFVSALQFFAFVILAASWFPQWLSTVQAAVRAGIGQAFSVQLGPDDLLTLIVKLASATLTPLALLGLMLMGLTLFLQMAATNMGFSLSRLTPKLSRLSPAQRLKELPSNNIAHFFQAVVMIPIMLWLTWSLVRDRLPEILRLPMMPVAISAVTAGNLLRDALKKSSMVLVMLGAVMLIRDRARYSKRLRMSKQDLRDESKENDGNPQTKARVRRIQRDLRRKNMMREVPQATAIIVNPTHFAVAIKYEQGAMTAPQGGGERQELPRSPNPAARH